MKLNYNAVDWHSLVYYDPTCPSGLRWKGSPHQRGGVAKKDSMAGTKIKGHYSLRLNRKRYQNHRVIWILFNGSIDNNLFIDHIDGNRANNVIDNLRLVTRELNARNTKMSRANKTGKTGVFLKDGAYYLATAKHSSGKSISKYFPFTKYDPDTAFQLACEWRDEAIRELNEAGAGYTQRHGSG